MKLQSKSIFFSDESILNKPTIIGYEKRFRWLWFATQLNTFIVATDFGKQKITKEILEKHLNDSFSYAKKNHKGWPRGFQSGRGVISMLISSDIDEEAKEYCQKLKSGKKWSAFTIPIIIDASNHQIYKFEKKPLWGAIYYPYFEKLIEEILA